MYTQLLITNLSKKDVNWIAIFFFFFLYKDFRLWLTPAKTIIFPSSSFLVFVTPQLKFGLKCDMISSKINLVFKEVLHP